ncbi:hypothetical protein [Maricaulis virginensis]|uniref:Nuclear transport factor 2 family protein n=1 Tax=Maricaulis virginensis TaxID=144022 RepID=A0A9W6IPA2_9PROT|nr:hypothetical protein [Maricaulis virginensis]GLK53119.1 hypothetical protein GCM10017621_26270 [Maricaulis virginensis]
MKHLIRAAFAASTAAIVIAPAQADDRADVEATVQAVYDVISGPVGQARDFDAMRDLYLPGAAMGAVSPGEDGQGRGRVITLDDYIERSGPWLVENGFTERPTRTETTIYGELAYVRSAYEGVSGVTGEVFVTGVNFITLFKIEGEWKIASILWRSADQDWPVDAAFD